MKDLTEYYNWLRLNYGAETVKGYFKYAKTFFNRYPEMTQETINAFFTAKIDTWKPKTWNGYTFRLKVYARYANLNIKFPKNKTDNQDAKPYLTEKEANEIADAMPVVVNNGLMAKLFILLLFYTGLRPKEILAIKKADFDFKNNTIITRNTKTHKDRPIHLPSTIVPAFKDIISLNPSDPNVFSLSYRTVNYMFEKINECLKPRFHIIPYSFRHGYAHYLLKKGVKLIDVSKALGHSKIETTFIYTNVTQNEALANIKRIIK